MVCKAKFTELTSDVFKQEDQNVMFHVDCPRCQSSSIIIINNSHSQYFTTFGILTDLTKNDVKDLDNIKGLTADDLLDYHSYISKHN